MSRIIIVTGGGTGMGREIAHRFADLGDRVYVFGRRAQPLEETAAYNSELIVPMSVDVTKPAAVQAAVDAIMADHKAIDVLVNCAGGSKRVEAGQKLEQALAAWQEVIDTNMSSVFLVTYAFTPYLSRPGGRVINVTSLAAFGGSSRVGGEAYAAAKAGIHGLTRTLVRVLGPEGITVNCVAPGVIEDTDFFNGNMPEDLAKTTLATTPSRRLGRPEDIAPAVIYLASPEASFVNGDILNVNGGLQFSR